MDGDQDRLTVAEAADRLGVSQDAVRKRIARGTIRHDRDRGRVFVYVDASDAATKTVRDTGQDTYVRSLEDQIRFLRQELERKDAILLRLAESIPALDSPGDPETPTDPGPSTETPPEPERGAQRPWWRRWFGG